MRTLLVTGSDTGVGKTRAAGALARLLAAGGARVQIVKPVETGGGGDAARARELAAGAAEAFTLFSFARPLAPSASARAEGRTLSLEDLLERVQDLPTCDWRIFEGAGGIATPIDGRDWADFGAAVGVGAVVIVVPDRLGAINQGRLAHARAAALGLRAGLWLNATAPVDPEVARSTREGLHSVGIPIWAEQSFDSELPNDPAALLARLSEKGCSEEEVPEVLCEPHRPPLGRAGRSEALGPRASGLAAVLGSASAAPKEPPLPNIPVSAADWLARCRSALAERDRLGLRRRLAVASPAAGGLDLADNDYLGLSADPAVREAAARAAARGTSASASPLITGWREEHERLTAELCAWHGFPCGLLFTSGYAANSAALGSLPRAGDRALADRLIHHSMIAGLLHSGARLRRYRHLDLDQLERWLEEDAGAGATFVATESVFSMDGDCPDLARIAALKRRHGFCWVLDEAHALGWYGPDGSGLAREAGAEAAVDVLVGTLGKALASGGAYALFRDGAARDYLANFAGEFVFSTAPPPPAIAAARAALARARELAPEQPRWRARSRAFRIALREAGWSAPEGDSPIVPVRLGSEAAALALAAHLAGDGIRAAAVRPPTVPAGTSRLRFSLKRAFGADEQARVLASLARWKGSR